MRRGTHTEDGYFRAHAVWKPKLNAAQGIERATDSYVCVCVLCAFRNGLVAENARRHNAVPSQDPPRPNLPPSEHTPARHYDRQTGWGKMCAVVEGRFADEGRGGFGVGGLVKFCKGPNGLYVLCMHISIRNTE